MVKCFECGKTVRSLNKVTDFHGNGICLACDKCALNAKYRLEIIFHRAGGLHPGEAESKNGCSPKGSPFIKSMEQLKELVPAIRAFVFTDTNSEWSDEQSAWLKAHNGTIVSGFYDPMGGNFQPEYAPVIYHEDEHIVVDTINELSVSFGGDKNAINKHSIRYYKVMLFEKPIFFRLDRNLSGSPKFFNLTKMEHDPRETSDHDYIPRTVKVEGKENWGDGYSWPKAETSMFNALFGHLLEVASV
jgi:hypothetical protein